MADNPQFEIPEPMRELAERNVEQARGAYAQFMEMARQAQEMMSRSQGVMASSAIEFQTKAMKFAEKNIEQGFSFAEDMARARDVKQVVEIQQRHAQKQMQAYAEQTQELGRLVTEAAQKAQPKS